MVFRYGVLGAPDLRPDYRGAEMSKTELTAERIEAVVSECEQQTNCSAFGLGPGIQRRAETTLALVESRKQALELLERWRRDGFSPELADAVVEYLEQNQ